MHVVANSTGKEYPKETSYFVCPSEVQKIYGEQPTELDVRFPLNDIEAIFPQRYCWYGSSRGVKCYGDGETAMRLNEQTSTMEQRECPCEKLDTKECAMRANLMVILDRVNVGGVYQIDVGSYNSIIDINSGLDYVQALIGRFSMVPLKLRRAPRETHAEGKKQTHYTLTVGLDTNDINFINNLRETTQRILSAPVQYALPAPILENPVFDEGATVEIESESVEEIPSLTQEEVIADLKKAGMIPEDNESNAPLENAKLLNKYASEILTFKEAVELHRWFNNLKRQSDFPVSILPDITKIVNDQLRKLDKIKK